MVENGGLPPQLGDRATPGIAARGERGEEAAMEAWATRPATSHAPAGQRRPAEYAMTEIGTLGGDESGAVALNAAGQVAGTATNANGNLRPFRWWHGALSALSLPPGCSNGVACAINAAGQVVGFARDHERGEQAVRWEGGAALPLPGLVARGEGYATAINGQGTVAGSARTAAGQLHATRWQGGLARDLGTLGGATSRAFGINDGGQIVGMAQDGHGAARAVIWQGDEVRDLGTPAGCASRALAINAGGLVVGSWLCASHLRRPFLWSGGALVELALPPGCSGAEATAINAFGQIVGCGWDERSGQRALLWADGVVIDLNTLLPPGSGWSLEWAGGIRDRGAIVGRGRHRDRQRAFLLAPVHGPPAARRETAAEAHRDGPAREAAPVRGATLPSRRPEW
jgi:probable HAF family extracellular repeat protein